MDRDGDDDGYQLLLYGARNNSRLMRLQALVHAATEVCCWWFAADR